MKQTNHETGEIMGQSSNYFICFRVPNFNSSALKLKAATANTAIPNTKTMNYFKHHKGQIWNIQKHKSQILSIFGLNAYKLIKLDLF